jgi:hypothetical protein
MEVDSTSSQAIIHLSNNNTTMEGGNNSTSGTCNNLRAIINSFMGSNNQPHLSSNLILSILVLVDLLVCLEGMAPKHLSNNSLRALSCIREEETIFMVRNPCTAEARSRIRTNERNS